MNKVQLRNSSVNIPCIIKSMSYCYLYVFSLSLNCTTWEYIIVKEVRLTYVHILLIDFPLVALSILNAKLFIILSVSPHFFKFTWSKSSFSKKKKWSGYKETGKLEASSSWAGGGSSWRALYATLLDCHAHT